MNRDDIKKVVKYLCDNECTFTNEDHGPEMTRLEGYAVMDEKTIIELIELICKAEK